MSINLSYILGLLLFVALIITISWFAIGRLINYLIARDIVDRPDHRTLHQGVVPRGGGLVIIVGLLMSLAITAFFSDRPLLFSSFFLLVFSWSLLSWYDDKYSLSAKFRLLVQILIATVSVFAFGWVSQIHSVKVFAVQLHWFGPLLTVIGLVWMANLYNFMDGLDGLAASQTIVSSLTLAFWFYMFGDMYLSLILLTLSALSYGFLLWNWHPAKVFMGDIGSIGLGSFFGLIFIIGVTRYDVSILSFLSLFAVFIADATITIVMRAYRREKIWLPHKKHYYQRLASIGYSHSSIAIAELILMVICSSLATFGLIYHDMIVVSIAAIFLVLLTCIIWVHLIERRYSQSQL